LTATSKPRSAARREIAAPIPRLPPVTIITPDIDILPAPCSVSQSQKSYTGLNDADDDVDALMCTRTTAFNAYLEGIKGMQTDSEKLVPG
jgi:hypothetical protein